MAWKEMAVGFGQGAGSAAGAKVFGGVSAKKSKRLGRYGLLNEFKYGLVKSDRYNWKMAQERGLTPQEYYGSPVPGGQTGYGPQGATLGNAGAQEGLQQSQIAANAITAGMQQQTQLGVAKIQADAQKYSADKSAEATTGAATISSAASMYKADIEAAIAANRLEFDEKTYRTIALPGAQAQLEVTRKQAQKLINEIATSDPKFVEAMKMLSMGTDNMVATMLAQSEGVKKPSDILKFDVEKRKAIIAMMIAASSNTRKEVEGLWTLVADNAAGFWRSWLPDFLGNVDTPGDEPSKLGEMIWQKRQDNALTPR